MFGVFVCVVFYFVDDADAFLYELVVFFFVNLFYEGWFFEDSGDGAVGCLGDGADLCWRVGFVSVVVSSSFECEYRVKFFHAYSCVGGFEGVGFVAVVAFPALA